MNSVFDPDKCLPANLDAERFVLGSILAGYGSFPDVAGALAPGDFSLEKHRRILSRMSELHDRGESIDRVTVANELMRHAQLESCDGLSYLVSLDDGLPQIANLDAYVRIVKDKSILRQTILAAQNLMNRCFAAADDSVEILADAEAVLIRLQGEQQHGEWLTPGAVIASHSGDLNAFLSQQGAMGIPTPWPRLTGKLAGLHPGELVVVAARPSMGKTVAAMQMAYAAAKRGFGTAMVSLEMNKESLVRWLIAAMGRVDHEHLRSGCLDHAERQRAEAAAAEIQGLPLWIHETQARTIPVLIAALRKLAARESLSVVLIDHFQLMTSTVRFENRHRELTEIAHSLKRLAQEFNIPVVLLSQLNRDCESEERLPQLTDLKETGTLEEDADVVWFIHRWERYARFRTKPEYKGQADFIIAKQREGAIGLVHMTFIQHQLRFEERAEIGDSLGAS